MMNRFFVGNFDFEHQLAGRHAAQHTNRIAEELASVWLGIAVAGDAIWMPALPDEEFPHHLRDAGFPEMHWISDLKCHSTVSREHRLACHPWGWSADVVNWALDQKLVANAPPLDVVRNANSRRFSFELEEDFHAGLPGTLLIQSIEGLNSAVANMPSERKWVIKSEFGMSARERFLGGGHQLPTPLIGWANKRLLAGQVLFFEPWQRAIAEAGLQFQIPPNGQGLPQHLGTTPLITDAGGAYRGSQFPSSVPSELDWSEAECIGQFTAIRLQKAGYFGPLGIDAMWYRDSQDIPRLRPLQDINARWTMGRLSLGFRDRLVTAGAGAWLHLRCPAKNADAAREWWNGKSGDMPSEVQLVRTSPVTVGGNVCQHATCLVASRDSEALKFVLPRLLGLG